MKLDKHVVDMFTELTKPADDVKMEKTCYGTISVVDGTRYVKLDGSDLLVPAASTVKTSHGDRVTVLMKNHSLTVTGNLTAPATDGEGGSSGEAGTAATIEVGTVTTGEAGSSASVTNSGTASAAVFDFVIPKGDKGEKGDTGPQGPQGEKGDTGTWDGTIPDHQHAVSDITDFPTSLPANGGDADTLGGKDSTDFVQNHKSYISEGSIKDFLLTSNSGCAFVSPNVTDMPIDSYTWWFLRIERPEGSHIAAYAANIGNSAEYRIIYNAASDSWSDWIAINDGGNADTLDGKHAESFMQWLGYINDTDFLNNANYKVDYHCNISDGTIIGLPVAGWYHIVYYMHSNLNGHGMQIAYPLNFDGATMIRRATGITWGTWTNIADGGNADTLDGKHADDFWKIYNHIDDSYDVNNATEPGLYRVRGGINVPTANWYDIHVTNLGGYITQIAISDNNSMYKRNFTSVWSEWIEFACKNDIPTTLPANGGIADVADIARRTVSYNQKAMLWEDIEGGNLRLISPDGNHTVEMDFYNNSFRMFFIDNGEVTFPVGYNSTTKKFNINGNADTVDGLHANEIASNPNLLINPDFRINQRGKSVYNGYGYTVDCWRCISRHGQVTVGDSGITISNTAGGECKIKNFIERDLTGKTITLSACIDGTVHKVSGVATTDMTTWSKQLKVYFDGQGGYLLFGSHQASPPIFFVMVESAEEKSYSIQWVKLELGGITTPFTPTDPATELAKCQRYYQIRSTNTVSVVNLRPSMRIAPTVTQIDSARYAYSAEL